MNFNNVLKYRIFILLIAYIGLQILLLYQFGIVTHFEAAKYIDQAHNLILREQYTSNNFFFYSTQILLIAVCIKLKIGFWFIVLLQIIANAFSLFLFHQLVKSITGRRFIAFGATLFFLGMFYYQLYNVHLFTESLFFSFSIFFAFYLFNLKKVNPISLLVTVMSLTILLFTRPTGVLFIPSTILFFIIRFGKKRALPFFVLSAVGGLTLFYFLLNAALNSGGEFDFLLPYIQEHVICGVPTVQRPHHITMPVNKNSVEGLWHLMLNNSDLFFSLIKKRFLAFWGVTRPFFSFGHNVFIAFYFYSLYILIFLGLKRMFTHYVAETVFMLTYIFFIMLTVLLSCDEWHNRFIFSILPFLLLLAAGVFARKKDTVI
ncbi:MAG TPA: hypothetical protein VEY10_16775 [Flavisolibacter sp.]|nr:hypothetical protein [Flavisolibacter sp.]